MSARSAALLLFLALAGPASASRVKSALRADATINGRHVSAWLTHKQRWCMSEEAAPACDGETIIDLYSAFYASAGKAKCGAPAGEAAGECSVNATNAVKEACQGKASCSVPPSFHPAACSGMASIRIVWDCVAGKPPSAPADTRRHLPMPKEVSAEEAREFNIADSGPIKVVTAEPEKAADPAKEVVEKAQQDEEHELVFNPCYRRTRWDMVTKGKFFDRLTSCPANEGCFKLYWLDGREFKDPESPPSSGDIATASLKEGGSLGKALFSSIGLERNEFDTWGVCLPKKQGMDFAAAVFEHLKSPR